MCTQGCQTFMWGGEGTPTHDEEGRCLCACEDDSWSDRNILGRASCVPAKANRVYGLVGLALCAAALGHAAYHLRRQLKFHEHHISASTSRIEQCRRKLHVTAIVFAASNMCYFLMVLAGLLRWSVVVLAVVQIPKSIAALLVGQMWICTLDPRLMQESPKVLAVTRWLEGPRLPYVVCGVVSIAPGISTVLAALAAMEASVRVMSAGLLLVIISTISTFLVCARSLVSTIDRSMQRKMEEQAEMGAVGSGGGEGGNSKVGGDPNLLAARTKIKSVVVVSMGVSSTVFFTLTLAILSEWGTAAPLIMFGIPLGPPPHIWVAKNIQAHAGRSKRPSPQGLLSEPPSPARTRKLPFSSSRQVVPTEGAARTLPR